MPQRFLRPGITTSDRWNSVDFFCQSLYIRILTRIDDYGRCDGRASVLLGECFSVWNHHHPEQPLDFAAVSCGLERLAAENLIEIYEVDGKKVLQVTQWKERIREGATKWWPDKQNPLRNPAESCASLLTPSPSPSPSPPTPTPTPTPTPSDAREGMRVPVILKELLPDKRVPPNGSPVLELTQRLNTLYHRPDDDPWTYEEQHFCAEIARRPHWQSEWETLIDFRKRLREKKYFPQSLLALLSGWTAQVDKARTAQKNPSLVGGL